MVALLVVLLIMVRVNGYVSLFGKSLFRVVSGSMEPTIMTGALLLADELWAERRRALPEAL